MKGARLYEHASNLSRDLIGAARLAAGLRSFLRLATDFVRFRLLRLNPARATNAVRVVRLRGGIQITYRLNRGDIWALHEVWIAESYRFPQAIPARTVVDIGANIGLAGLWLAKEYGAARVLAVEPSAANARIARRNLCENGLEAEVIEVAVGAEEGTAAFYEVASSTNCRADFTRAAQSGENVVRVASMAAILKALPDDAMLDLVKIDVEGAEREIFRGDLSWLRRVGALMIEFHLADVDYPALAAQIEASGLRRIKAVPSDVGAMLDYYVRGGAETRT